MKQFAEKKEALELYQRLLAVQPVRLYEKFTSSSSEEVEGFTGRAFSVSGIAVPDETSAVVRIVKPHIGVNEHGVWGVWVTSLKTKKEAVLEHRTTPCATVEEKVKAVLLANKDILAGYGDLRTQINLLCAPLSEREISLYGEFREVNI